MTELMSTPWTQQGRENAIQKAVGEIYAAYFAKGPRWIAKHLSQRAEMGNFRGLVSPQTAEMLLGNYGIESYVDDYALISAKASGDSLSSKGIYTQWIFDEMRHPEALWYALIDSGLYTPAQMAEYKVQASEHLWTFEEQTGHEATPERGAAYAVAQERQTKKNYQDLSVRIWEEYGCPTDPYGRPIYPAIAGVCRILAKDEGFHEGVFRQITRVYLKFWPDKALQAMWDVYEKYRMPIVKLPNAEAFIDAVLSTGIDSPRQVVTEVLNPTYEAFGLGSRMALRRAARDSWDLPEGAVIQIGDDPSEDWTEGVIPFQLNPNGSLTEIAKAA